MNTTRNRQSSIQFHALPPDTCLHDAYSIKGILGEGGFGITYDGCSTGDGMRVAIKEYFPRQIALRTEQDGHPFMQPFPEKYAETYEKGRQRFLREAETLHRLQHLESIVSIYDSFEENGTAYIIMEYIDGPTLEQFVTENGVLAFPELAHLADPLIRALSEVHRQGIIHRDISPDNLILGLDNKLHLIDFGAVTHDNPEGNKNTVILKAGYAPPEQYISNGNLGAWVDVYALCATMYFALTAKAPCEAMHRLDAETEETLPGLGHLLPRQRAAIEKGLQLRSANRFHDMMELYDALITAKEEDAKTQLGSPLSKQDKHRLAQLYRPRKIRRNLAAVGLFLLLLLAGMFALPRINAHVKNTDGKKLPRESTSTDDHAAASASPETAASPDTLLKTITPTKIKASREPADTNRISPSKESPGTNRDAKSGEPAATNRDTATKRPIATKHTNATKSPSSDKSKNTKKKDYDVKGDSDYTTIPLE